MKQIILLMALATGILMACKNNTGNPPDTKPISRDTTGSCYTDTVSKVLCRLDSAQQDISLFDSLSRKYLNDSSAPIRAYTVRAVDLLDALGLPAELADSSICQYKYIRAYLGYRQGVGFKLYIVPVTDACLRSGNGGSDVVLNSAGGVAAKGSSQATYVLDLNAPCPRTCPTNSIMQ